MLWLEYLSRQPEGYRYTQFCEHFRAWQRRSRPPRMRQLHRAGAALEVDWAGLSPRYVERLLKADRQRPFLDTHPEEGLGEHGNLRGSAYYN